MMPEDGASYSPKDIAERWSVSTKTVRALIHAGRLEAFRAGPRMLRVLAETLAAYEARKVAEPPKGRPVLTAEEREAARDLDRRQKIILSAVKVGSRRREAERKKRLEAMKREP